MALRIEDYAVIGDTQTAAIVGRDGSIDWLCLPRFDSASVFGALIGGPENGYWRIAPKASPKPGTAPPLLATRRSYRGETLVLETEFVLPEGTVRILDCMPVRSATPEVVRVVECTAGRVEMHMDMVMRFGYGQVVPWVRRTGGTTTAIAGPDAIALWSPVRTSGEDLTTVADFVISEGQRTPFVLSWYPSHQLAPHPVDGNFAIGETTKWWESWSSLALDTAGRWRDAVQRSAITLKALTYAPTGGIVAAVTTSLPETLGGVRNWDYRYCWLRDATFTLSALMAAGYHEEAGAWRDWLLRAVAGDPARLQIMYGAAGERFLAERELAWLDGYAASRPVRAGNAASDQFQLDVYGEVISALHESRRAGLDPGSSWDLEIKLLEFLEDGWREPDEGIWEVRGPRRHFTHSKVMAWVALDRAVRDVEEFGLEGPIDRWRALAAEVHGEVCANGYDPDRKTFTQFYGSHALDAACLMIPLVGFLPPTDARVIGTVEAIRDQLTSDGFVLRYDAENAGSVDGLTGREGAFLACSFWMVDALDLIGRHDEAISLFEQLIALRNDVGLLSEEYDPVAKRLVGNFPQAFSHVSLVNSAVNLSRQSGLGAEVSHRGRVAGHRFSIAHRSRLREKSLDPSAVRGYRQHH